MARASSAKLPEPPYSLGQRAPAPAALVFATDGGRHPSSSAAVGPLRQPWLAVLAAPAGAGILLAAYLGLITWAQGREHALDQLRVDLWFIVPIVVEFGAQIGLFVYLRWLRSRAPGGMALTAGSTGVSGAAMLACCAHHVSDVLPLVGVSGAAIFLNDAKTPSAIVGIVLNALGVAYLIFHVLRVRSGSARSAEAKS